MCPYRHGLAKLLGMLLLLLLLLRVLHVRWRKPLWTLRGDPLHLHLRWLSHAHELLPLQRVVLGLWIRILSGRLGLLVLIGHGHPRQPCSGHGLLSPGVPAP